MHKTECGVCSQKRGIGTTVVLAATVIFFAAGPGFTAEKDDFQFRKQAEIQQIRPPKPVRVKLHRTAKGEYTWELTGDNADELIQADKKLRKLLKLE